MVKKLLGIVVLGLLWFLPYANSDTCFAGCGAKEAKKFPWQAQYVATKSPNKMDPFCMSCYFLGGGYTLEEAKKKGWWLVLIGFGDQGKFVSQLETFPIENCRAYGPVFGKIKQAVFHHSTAFILPSFSEGLPMAALEAMSHHTPCLLSSACNIPEAFNAGAALNAEPEPQQLSSALRRLFALKDDEIDVMAASAYDLVKEKFSWNTVTKLCSEVYSWMLNPSSIKPRSFYWSDISQKK